MLQELPPALLLYACGGWTLLLRRRLGLVWDLRLPEHLAERPELRPVVPRETLREAARHPSR